MLLNRHDRVACAPASRLRLRLMMCLLLTVNFPCAQGQGPGLIPSVVKDEVWRYLQQFMGGATCTSPTLTKQSCLFHNVCFVFSGTTSETSSPTELSVVRLQGSTAVSLPNVDGVLQQQLNPLLQGFWPSVRYFGKNQADALARVTPQGSNMTVLKLWTGDVQHVGNVMSPDSVLLTRPGHIHGGDKDAPTLLWDDRLTIIARPGPHQYSFGHALGNNVMPLFLMLSNHIPEGDIPTNLQLLVAAGGWEADVLPNLLRATLTHNMHMLPEWLTRLRRSGLSGVCFRNLLLGDGGHHQLSMEALGGMPEAQHFSTRPTLFNNRNWEALAQHGFKVSGIMPGATTRARPLIVLNDKRCHRGNRLQDDKRAIADVDKLAISIKNAYPGSDVLAVRFRDMPMVEQIQVMAATRVFITTAGSSSHLAVFMRSGGTVVMLGGPEDEESKKSPHIRFTPFDELDRWFPLTYVQFLRYAVDINDVDSYTIKKLPGDWEPGPGAEQDRWWRYNANIRVDMHKLKPMLDQALGV